LGYLYEYACCECEQRALVFRGLKGINTPCPPPCTPGYCIGTHAGYNNISNTFSYTGRLINFTKGGVQEAMRNYWYYGGGSAAPNGFVGAVDTSFPLRSAVSTPAKAVPILSGDTPLGVDPEGDKLIGWILRLEEKVDSNAGDAVDAIHHLSAMIGPGGAYADVTVGSSWRDILTRVKNSSASPRLVRLAKSMGIRDALNEGTFGEGIRLADDLLNSDIDDDTWLYCKTRKIFGFVGLGNLRQANAVFAEMQSRGRMVDTAAMNGMEDYLRLAALSVSVDGSQGESVKQSTAESKTTPRTTSIAQNYPNPFNPVTSFTYQIASAGHVSLKIYDVLGREVATIVDGVKEPGEYNVSWEANGFSSGVYFFKLQADSFSAVKKMLLIR